MVWAISVGGKNNGLMRPAVRNSEDDWPGVVEAQRAEEVAAAAMVTEVKVDKVPMLNLLLSLAHAHGRT